MKWDLRCSTCGKFLSLDDLNSGRSTYTTWLEPIGANGVIKKHRGECWRCKEKIKPEDIDEDIYTEFVKTEPWTPVLRPILALILIGICAYLGYSNHILRVENNNLHINNIIWESRYDDLRFETAQLEGRFYACDLIQNAQKLIIEDNTDKILTVTAYTATPEECNNDPFHTALMTRPSPGRTVAVSWDLMDWLGKEVYIEGIGVRKVEDLMHPRWTNRIDIMVPYVEDAQEFGVQERQVVLLMD